MRFRRDPIPVAVVLKPRSTIAPRESAAMIVAMLIVAGLLALVIAAAVSRSRTRQPIRIPAAPLAPSMAEKLADLPSHLGADFIGEGRAEFVRQEMLNPAMATSLANARRHLGLLARQTIAPGIAAYLAAHEPEMAEDRRHRIAETIASRFVRDASEAPLLDRKIIDRTAEPLGNGTAGKLESVTRVVWRFKSVVARIATELPTSAAVIGETIGPIDVKQLAKSLAQAQQSAQPAR